MKKSMKTGFHKKCVIVTIVSFFTVLSALGQKADSYTKLWNEIEKLKADGLSQSAINNTTDLIQKAKKEARDDQYIKGQIYRMYFRGIKEEDAIITSLEEMESEITNSTGNRRAILHSAVAEMYWWYYSSRRWDLARQTPTDDTISNDIKDWGSRQFIEVIHKHYQSSVENDDLLKQNKAEAFELIWLNGEETRTISPTLYDVLMRRAINFYSNNLSGLTLARDQFYLDDKKYFVSANKFIALNPDPTEYISFDRISLQLYQDILKFHLAQKHESASAYYDLSRLQFIYSKYLFSNRDSLYENALIQAFKQYQSSEVSSEIAYNLAKYYNGLANRYNHKNLPEYKWFNKKAIEWCDKAIVKDANSRGAELCKNLANAIKEIHFDIVVEAVNYPEKPISYAVNYKNTSKLYFRLYDNSSNRLIKKAEGANDQNVQYFLSKEHVLSWENELIDSMDYQNHGMEFILSKLKSGYYALLVSESPNFSTKENVFSLNFFWVSELAYLFRQVQDGGAKILVTNRSSGKPLKDVKANYYKEQYNHTYRRIELIDEGEGLSNENGMISMPSSDDQRNFRVLLSKGNDSLVISQSIYVRKPQQNMQKKSISSSIFTDRAIYRPGQAVYFKGLVLEKGLDEQVTLVKDRPITIKLMDMNAQEVARMDVVTSEFGSYNGTFLLPASTLTGNFFLDDGIGRRVISIEEYKRPNFIVELKEIKENVRIGEKVSIHGIAKSFNDVPLNNAKGSFNVQRFVRMGIPYYGYGYLPMHKAEVAFGEFTTDEKGHFEITFEALPDKSLPKEKLPIFQFTAEVMVSDLNGESQRTEMSIPVGYHSLNLSMDLKQEVNKSELDSVIIYTRNLSGVFTPADVSITITSLLEPEETITEMMWNRPDYMEAIIDQAISNKKYKDEQLMELWPMKKQVLSKKIRSAENKKVALNELSKLPSGPYEIHLKSVDPFAQEVSWSKRVLLYNESDKKIPIPASSWSSLQTLSCNVGEQAVILVGSNNQSASVYYTIGNKDGLFLEKWLSINGSLKQIKIPIQEKDRGGLSIQLAMVSNGKAYTTTYFVQVPFDNKKLKLKLNTFRDKIKPGDTETWTIDITDNEGNLVKTEVLASMYDASLDNLREFNWWFSPFNVTVPRFQWNNGNNFSADRSRSYPFKERKNKYINPRVFDQLNWFGFSYYGGVRHYMSLAGNEEMMDDGPVQKSMPMAKEPVTADSDLEDPDKAGKTDKKEEERLRNDFRETAFFYPTMQTSDSGRVEFSFEVPDALTKWKVQVLAHTADLKYGLLNKEVTSSKDLMVVPNYPRFLVAEDTLIFSAKVSNLTATEMDVSAEIKVSNALTSDPIQVKPFEKKRLKIDAKSNGLVQWRLIAPEEAGLINVAVYAKSKEHQDGEVRSIPILSKEILVTETYPISLRSETKKNIEINKLDENYVERGIKPERLTLEFTSNPSWYVVQALPYISNINNESCDQLFNRYYANSIGRYIMRSNDKIKEVIGIWRQSSPEAFLSSLEKNEELKQTVLNETPWLLEGNSESDDKRQIALFFEENNLENSLNRALYELLQSQSPNGGWPWFKGLEDNRFITQQIALGMARLNNMKVISINQHDQLRNALESAVSYLDSRMDEEYKEIVKRSKKPEDDHLSALHIQYLFMRSYYPVFPIRESYKEAHDYFMKQCEKYWLKKSNYSQAMMALTFNRQGNTELPNKIIASLKENALHSEEFGMYWKTGGAYHWYNSTVESQAMLIEAFTELVNDEKEIEDLKMYLLKQKQTKKWRTGRASVEACYALLLQGTDNLSKGNTISLTIGDQSFEFSPAINAEAGTGYFKSSWNSQEIKPEMGQIEAENKGNSISWGAAYYQFFQEADKVDASKTGLSIERNFYVKRYTNQGEVLKKITDEVHLERGDVVVVKMSIKSDRELDFVHLKDMRAAGLEPMQEASGYRYSAALGYYLSIKDASTNFYFNRLNKGSINLEYELKASNSGLFSAGIATIQSFYSPEFSSHSKGEKIRIE